MSKRRNFGWCSLSQRRSMSVPILFAAMAFTLFGSPSTAQQRECIERLAGVCLKYKEVRKISRAETTELALSLDSDERRFVQRGLMVEGFYTGAVDGLFGRGTRSALRQWQESRGLLVTGYLTLDQVAELKRRAGAEAQSSHGIATQAPSVANTSAPKNSRDGQWVGRLKCEPVTGDWGTPIITRPEGLALSFEVERGQGVWMRGPLKPGTVDHGAPFHERWELRLFDDGRALVQGVFDSSPTPARLKLSQNPVLLEGHWADGELRMSGNRGPRPCKLELSRY